MFLLFLLLPPYKSRFCLLFLAVRNAKTRDFGKEIDSNWVCLFENSLQLYLARRAVHFSAVSAKWFNVVRWLEMSNRHFKLAHNKHFFCNIFNLILQLSLSIRSVTIQFMFSSPLVDLCETCSCLILFSFLQQYYYYYYYCKMHKESIQSVEWESHRLNILKLIYFNNKFQTWPHLSRARLLLTPSLPIMLALHRRLQLHANTIGTAISLAKLFFHTPFRLLSKHIRL